LEFQKATQEYRDDQDILLDFINECCNVTSSACHILTKELYNEYLNWCEQNKEYPLKSKSFNATMEEKGFKRVDSGHGRQKEYIGISLKESNF